MSDEKTRPHLVFSWVFELGTLYIFEYYWELINFLALSFPHRRLWTPNSNSTPDPRGCGELLTQKYSPRGANDNGFLCICIIYITRLLGSHGRYVKHSRLFAFRITHNFGFFKMKNARNFGFIAKDFNGDLYRGCIVDVDEDADNCGLLYSV